VDDHALAAITETAEHVAQRRSRRAPSAKLSQRHQEAGHARIGRRQIERAAEPAEIECMR
jgi:hypothetical protein